MTVSPGPDRRPAWIGLGSNLDQPAHQVARGLGALGRLPATVLTNWSSAYRTRAWGLRDQPDFINAVARLETGLSPSDLLARLQSIESEAGRQRDPDKPWGPRTLDLDLLLFADDRINTRTLVVPHPAMARRAFVLAPLIELEPTIRIPGQGLARECLASLDDSDILSIDPIAPEPAGSSVRS